MHHISNRQLLWLTTVGVISAGMFTVPRKAYEIVGTGGWLIILVNGVLIAIPALAMVAVGSRFPGRLAADYVETLLGKWLGKVMALFILISFLVQIMFTTRLFLDIVSFIVLPFTPLEAVVALFFVVAAYMAAQRLELIARGAGLLAPIISFLFILLLLRGARNVDIINLRPLFHMEGSMLKGVFHNANVFLGVQTLWITVAALRMPQKAYKSVLTGIGLVTALYLAITALTVGSLGVARTTELSWPGIEAIRASVSLANVTGPPGLLLLIIWTCIVFASTALHIHAAAVTGLRWLGLSPSYRTTAVIIVSIVTAVLSVKLFPSRLDFFEALDSSNVIGWGIYFVPLLLLAVALARRKKGTSG